jgi:hypothetical protein
MDYLFLIDCRSVHFFLHLSSDFKAKHIDRLASLNTESIHLLVRLLSSLQVSGQAMPPPAQLDVL